MFDAELISLGDGQSYEHVQICEAADLVKYDIPLIFENWTGCVFADGKCFIIHHWKIKVIHLNRNQRGGNFSAERLVLDGDITYSPVAFIDSNNWARFGIPEFFVKRSGIAGQMVWTCPQGTFITHDTNVTSIVVPDPRPKGITMAEQPGVDSVTPTQQMRAEIAPETIHGKLDPRKLRFG